MVSYYQRWAVRPIGNDSKISNAEEDNLKALP